jgi:uridine kinase
MRLIKFLGAIRLAAVLIAVAGGSCSGKTTLVQKVRETIGDELCTIVYQDDYYRPNLGDPVLVNFDHPDSLDFDLMGQHISQLKQGQSIETPIYDFTTHDRLPDTITLAPTPLIFIEGILVLNSPEIRDAIDFGVFVGCDEQVRYERRSQRDTVERGRTPEDIERQFFTQVAPMHNTFVEPSSEHADLIINDSDSGLQTREIEQFIAYCEQLMAAD